MLYEVITQWEISEMSNIGIDFPMFADRMTITLEGYFRKTKDIMWKDYKIPTSSGYTQLDVYNGGEMSNKGVEFNIQGTVAKWGPKKKNSLQLNANLSRNIRITSYNVCYTKLLRDPNVRHFRNFPLNIIKLHLTWNNYHIIDILSSRLIGRMPAITT